MGQMRTTTVSKAVAAAGDYAAGDVLSESATNGAGTAWAFENAAIGGNTVSFTSATLTCSEDSVVFRLRLHLFSANPSASELDDNAAKNFAAADRANFLGYIDFAALTDQGVPSWAMSSSVPFEGRLKTNHVYGVLETLDAEANESAGMTISISLNTAWG